MAYDVDIAEQVGIRQSSQIPLDLRAYAQALLTSLPSELLIPYLYPTFYSLHDMPPEVHCILSVLNVTIMTLQNRRVPSANTA
jgi:hypothetical protein